MRCAVVVCLLTACFSKPGLRDGDGGVGDADDGDGGGIDGTIDGGANCTWTDLGVILHEADLDERGPWSSADGKTVVFWRGAGSGSGVIMQAKRASVSSAFSAPLQIYPAVSGTPNVSGESDPALTADLLAMYLTSNSGHLQSATRATANDVFSAPQDDPQLAMINNLAQVREGPHISDDGRMFLFVAGLSSNPYNTEDLYIARRTAPNLSFDEPVAFEHNVTGKNECCPTMAGDLIMYERPAGTPGKTEIVQSVHAGAGYSAPLPVALPGSDSFQHPALSADGQHLFYVTNSGTDWRIHEARLDCE